MKKLRPAFIILFIVSLILLLAMFFQEFIKKQNSMTKNLDYDLIEVGYSEDISDDEKTKLFTSYLDLNEYLKEKNLIQADQNGEVVNFNSNELLNKFNEDFFEKNNLALVYIKLANSAHKVEVDSIEASKTKLTIRYDVSKTAGSHALMLMDGYFITVPCDKTINKIVIK